MLAGGAFVLTGLLQAAIAVALFFWGQSIAARRRSRAWWWASLLPLCALILATSGGIGSAVVLVRSFDAIADTDASQKAHALSDGIGHAMNIALFTTVPAWFLYVGSVIASTIGTLLPLDPDSVSVPPGGAG